MTDDARDPAAGARTGSRLAMALLGYFVLVTLVITLSPFDFAPRPLRLSLQMSPSDIVANVAMFLPAGFLIRSLDGGPAPPRLRAVALLAGLSLFGEIGQIFVQGRYVSPVDVVANTCGGLIGVVLRDRVERWTVWRPGAIGRAGLDIPLVGLLYLLVPQMWLSGVGLMDDPLRSVTTLLLGCAGSIVLVAVHRHRWHGSLSVGAKVVLPIALVWFMVGALPALAASPGTFGTLALAVVSVTWCLLRPGDPPAERRFEADTLRRFLPVFALYLVAAALWPPFRSLTPWHGAVGFVDRLNDSRVIDVLELLEQVGGFTLFGYAAAEWRGRREQTLSAVLPRVTLLAVVLVSLLEGMQGMLAGPGASLLRALLSIAGAMYGAAVYHLARAHVRALRALTAESSAPPRRIAHPAA